MKSCDNCHCQLICMMWGQFVSSIKERVSMITDCLTAEETEDEALEAGAKVFARVCQYFIKVEEG